MSFKMYLLGNTQDWVSPFLFIFKNWYKQNWYKSTTQNNNKQKYNKEKHYNIIVCALN